MPRAQSHVTFTTTRLHLSAWRDAVLEPVAAPNADERVMEHCPKVLNRAESDALAHRAGARILERGFGLWAVEVPGVALFMGYVGLATPSFEASFTPCIEIGWRLAYDRWRRGYAPEAAAAVLRYGFENAGDERNCIVYIRWQSAITPRHGTHRDAAARRRGLRSPQSCLRPSTPKTRALLSSPIELGRVP